MTRLTNSTRLYVSIVILQTNQEFTATNVKKIVLLQSRGSGRI